MKHKQNAHTDKNVSFIVNERRVGYTTWTLVPEISTSRSRPAPWSQPGRTGWHTQAPWRPTCSHTGSAHRRDLDVRLWPSCWSDKAFLIHATELVMGENRPGCKSFPLSHSRTTRNVARMSCFTGGCNAGRRLESLLQHTTENGICQAKPEFKMLCSTYSDYEEGRKTHHVSDRWHAWVSGFWNTDKCVQVRPQPSCIECIVSPPTLTF